MDTVTQARAADTRTLLRPAADTRTAEKSATGTVGQAGATERAALWLRAVGIQAKWAPRASEPPPHTNLGHHAHGSPRAPRDAIFQKLDKTGDKSPRTATSEVRH